MPDKVDYKKQDKHIYKPSAKKPEIIEMPEFAYIMIDGEGPPQGEVFQKSVKALYTVAYKIRMSHKKGLQPPDYYEYVVPPLEGIWDVVEGTEYNPADKSNLKWTIMIRQPEFVIETFFDQMKALALKPDDSTFIEKVRYEKQTDGLCCHMLHLGPFDSEPETFEKIHNWLNENGYQRISKAHREIYLSDFNKTAPEKLKTVLRVKIEKRK